MKALEENNGYEIFIIYPPPINFFTAPFLILSFSKKTIKKLSVYFMNFAFWAENLFVLVLFFFYMLVHFPLIMLKTYF